MHSLYDYALKVASYITLYGFRRTLFKIAGRTRKSWLSYFSYFNFGRSKNIAIIGCGQYSFATIGFFIYSKTNNGFFGCYDTNDAADDSFREFYNIKRKFRNSLDLFQSSTVKYVYIASNHASHTAYAIKALECNKTVYIEKPICVSWEQYNNLLKVIRKSAKDRIYFGYNRPFSKAIAALRKLSNPLMGPITLTCIVFGHALASDHWYRLPEEGTRVCGNLGHWLDLAIHILNWREPVRRFEITIAYSKEIDDNLTINFSTEFGDLISITLTSRHEPATGIREQIFFQSGELLAEIIDFSYMSVRKGNKVINTSFRPKDVGHELALLQPFGVTDYTRPVTEVLDSTALMLHIHDMVLKQLRYSVFKLSPTGSQSRTT